MAIRVCPTCNGTGRVEVETMNKEQMKIDLKKGVIHNVHHAIRHPDDKVVVEKCLRAAWGYADKVLEELEKEEPEPLKPSKLAIHNGIFCYKDGGTIPIKLIGVSRWEALWKEIRLESLGWGDKDLTWYENELFKYPTNYVTHGAIPDFQLVYDHCKRLRDHGKIVEVTVFRGMKDGLLIRLEDAINLIELGNVFFDACREFGDNEECIYKTKEIVEFIVAHGGIVGAGAWGWSHKGEENSEKFHEICDAHQVETVHRNWDIESIEKALQYGKPVVRNEYFARYEPALTLEDTKRIMRETFEVGGQGIQYYGFAIPEIGLNDPFDYRLILEYAGELCQELNGG